MFRILVFLISFVLGLFLIFYDPGSRASVKDARKSVVGEVSSLEGSASGRGPDEFQFKPLHLKDQIFQLDTITVEPQSTAQIKMVGGTLIELQPQTQVVFDRAAKSQTIEVVVLEGKAEILQMGETGEVSLIENQIPLTAKDKSNRPAAPAQQKADPEGLSTQASPQEVSQIAEPRSAPPAPSFQEKSLSRDYIQNVLSEQKRFVQSCFVRYFNQQSGKVQFGTTLLGFMIEPSGKVTQTRVLKSEITDRNYQDCLVSIISRTRFKTFHAAPIDMEYPVELSPP